MKLFLSVLMAWSCLFYWIIFTGPTVVWLNSTPVIHATPYSLWVHTRKQGAAYSYPSTAPIWTVYGDREYGRGIIHNYDKLALPPRIGGNRIRDGPTQMIHT